MILAIPYLPIKFSLRGLFIKFMLFSVPMLALSLYNLQLFNENSYTGVIALDADPLFYLMYIVWVSILAALYPLSVKRPVDIFSTFYIPIVCLCSSVYWKNTGLLDEVKAFLMLAFLLLPVVALKLLSIISFPNFSFSVRNVSFYSDKKLPHILILILVIAAVAGYSINGSVGGFDILSSYDRRLAGRIAFADHTFFTYLFDNAMNGVLPILAFIAGTRKQFVYYALSILFALFSFWLLGTKATFLYIVLMFSLGKICADGKIKKLPTYFLAAVTLLFVIAMLECLINGRSVVADYIIRRTFMAGTQIQAYYIDAIFNDQHLPYTLLSGVSSNISPSLFIGEMYFGNMDTNANTNAFLYSLALGGLPGLLFCIAFICVFFHFLDKKYRKTEGVNMFGIASLYTLLLLEQAFSTALVSSGVFLCFILIFAARKS